MWSSFVFCTFYSGEFLQITFAAGATTFKKYGSKTNPPMPGENIHSRFICGVVFLFAHFTREIFRKLPVSGLPEAGKLPGKAPQV